MENLYYIYDKSGIDKKSCNDLSSRLEKLGYNHYQPEGLGAGPSPEQVILWMHNNQFVSEVSIGILSNYVYDLLKDLFSWFESHKYQSQAIPVVEIFLHFKDIKSKRTRGELKLRIDRLRSKKVIEKYIQSHISILYSSSEEDLVCAFCKKTIHHNQRFYLRMEDQNKSICQDCFNDLEPRKSRGN